MNRFEIKALRRLLFFTRPEAARLVAANESHPDGVADRAWRQWEDGDRPIPAYVAKKLAALAQWRRKVIDVGGTHLRSALAGDGVASAPLLWYENHDDWSSLPGRDPVRLGPHQSAMAALLVDFPQAKLVCFDMAAYRSWLGARKDSESMRQKWAASVQRARQAASASASLS